MARAQGKHRKFGINWSVATLYFVQLSLRWEVNPRFNHPSISNSPPLWGRGWLNPSIYSPPNSQSNGRIAAITEYNVMSLFYMF